MSEWFEVGIKVVCVNAEPLPGTVWFEGEGLREGQVYTVAEIFEESVLRVTCFRLSEISRTVASLLDGKFGYAAYRFRPVRKRATDISVFTVMLDPTKEPADA